jgi:hypothetical protein
VAGEAQARALEGVELEVLLTQGGA